MVGSFGKHTILRGGKMTRRQLEQIAYTSRELRMWERELERLRARYPISSLLPRNGSGSGISDPTACNAEQIISLEGKVQGLRDKLQRERDEAVQFIMTIPDSVSRRSDRGYSRV